MIESIKKILLVDDEPEFIETLKRHLRREGFRVDSANSGITAQQKIEGALLQGEPFDMVITDVMMPLMDGIELLEWIKEIHREISVLVISGFGDSDIVRESIRPRLDGYCRKPLTPTKMMSLIHRINNKRRKVIDAHPETPVSG